VLSEACNSYCLLKHCERSASLVVTFERVHYISDVLFGLKQLPESDACLYVTNCVLNDVMTLVQSRKSCDLEWGRMIMKLCDMI
jgi:hypothetical protein